MNNWTENEPDWTQADEESYRQVEQQVTQGWEDASMVPAVCGRRKRWWQRAKKLCSCGHPMDWHDGGGCYPCGARWRIHEAALSAGNQAILDEYNQAENHGFHALDEEFDDLIFGAGARRETD